MSGSVAPSMSEIERIPFNGFNAVSTFSGGGGSCLGFRMAGYKVVWANEFVPEAQETYRANHKDTFLNCKDIRSVTAEDIIEESGLKKGEIDLFDGSPPCSSFSTAGKREKDWGKVKSYSSTKQRTDDLFFEYIRLVDGLQPKVFVAENVSGLVKGKAKGYFKIILKGLIDCGYEVSARLVNFKYLGVPQARERLIFIGVRNDLVEQGLHPSFPKPSDKMVTLRDVLEGVQNDEEELEILYEQAKKHKWGVPLRQMRKNPVKPIRGSAVMNGSYFNLIRESMYEPCSTICQRNGVAGASGNCHPLEDRKFTINEVKRITTVPDDFILTGKREEQWERMGRMVPPVGMMKIAKTIQTDILEKCAHNAKNGGF